MGIETARRIFSYNDYNPLRRSFGAWFHFGSKRHHICLIHQPPFCGKLTEIFRGFHDFASFADKRIDKHLSTEVQIDWTDLEPRGDLILFRIVGSHFLWKMVRRLAGILVEAGRGTLSPAEVERMLTNASELPARCTAPPSGLFLAQVLYEGDCLGPLLLPPLPLLLKRS
jgi:tRNA pseudouridine(38-40) synthase